MGKEGLAILTSGGDAAGMNPATKCSAEHALKLGYKVYLISNGLSGMIDDKISEMTPASVSGMMFRGGSLLGSSRSKRFYDKDFRKVAFENLERRNITKLVNIGGDGSFRAMHQFESDFGIPFAGIPATIDNDVPETDYCLGVDTALNIIRHSIDIIRDTASSFRRAFVIETMGRDCGYLAMVSALSSGAEICLVPELAYDLDKIGGRLKNEIEGGRDYILAVVAEGTKMGDYLCRWIAEALEVDARLTVLGHVQRGGSPTVRDRIMAYQFAVAAVNALHAGEKNVIVSYREGSCGIVPVEKITERPYQIDPNIIDLCKPLCS